MIKSLERIGLSDVQSVYSGSEGRLWKLIMGEQIHIGGFQSSMDLAERAGIGRGMSGIDLCCCLGGGMRFLVRFRGVESMRGVDATPAMVEEGIRLCEEEGLSSQITFILGDACASGLPDSCADFIWGEDAWCYVVDKPKLISEAARMVRPAGLIAFTDWIIGSTVPSDPEMERYMSFMKFPNVLDMQGYRCLLENNGCEVLEARDTGRFHSHVDLYITMLSMQFTYDALKIIGFDKDLMDSLAGELIFIKELAHDGKIAQGLFIGRKT